MQEEELIQTITAKAKTVGINPLLLLSGIEGLYSFKEVALNDVNFELLDSLILTIFALRIGDQFHTLAEQNLRSTSATVMQAAALELRLLSPEQIAASSNQYLHAFATLLSGKALVRGYHEKALEVAALEIRKAQQHFKNDSIGHITIYVCKEHLAGEVDLGALFRQ